VADIEVEVEGRRLKLSNLEKVMYPETGFTKGQVIDYYTRIAPALLPHLRRRPLTLKRYPNGVDGGHFYEKRCPSHRPDWVNTVPVWSDRNVGVVDYCVADDLPTLTWVAQLASLELHTSLATAADVACPTMVVFDLDPGAPAALLECCRVSLLLRDVFDHLGLEAFPKTSGSKGLQVYVPLNDSVTYDHTKPFAHAVARLLEKEHPAQITSVMDKAVRGGKVFVDWSQNDEHKTTVCVYSLRARPRPTVSTPVTWQEIEAAVADDEAGGLDFDATEVLARVERDGDLFAPVAELRQALPAGLA
jgi:bifunctional non-homologous end joining protein LigD